MHPAQPMDKMDEGAGATAPDLHKVVSLACAHLSAPRLEKNHFGLRARTVTHCFFFALFCCCLLQAVAADRRRRSSVSSDPALMALAAARHQAAGASSSPRDRTDRPEPLNMRAFASEMRNLVSPGPNSGSPLARVKGDEGGGRSPMSGGGGPLARIRAEEDAGGRGTPIARSLQRGESLDPRTQHLQA
jgi:hypothetical protein